MRIIRSSDLPAVVLVKRRGLRMVAIPATLSPDEVLELASLVLSAGDYEEFRYRLEASADTAPQSASALPPFGTP